MSTTEKFKEVQKQLATIRSYSEPYLDQMDNLFREYHASGYTAEEIAEETGWKVISVKGKLTKLGLGSMPLLKGEDFQVHL